MIVKALANLVPNSSWIVEGDTYDGIQWLDKNKTKPTEKEITNEVARLKLELVANSYKQKRLAEYPTWNEQLDNIYHNGIDAWKANIKAIKDKYPKGDE